MYKMRVAEIGNRMVTYPGSKIQDARCKIWILDYNYRKARGMAKQNPLIIVNPKSGKGLTEKSWASTAGTLHKHLGAFDFEFTKGSGDATSIAQRESRKGRKLIIAFGGDGTISEVA